MSHEFVNFRLDSTIMNADFGIQLFLGEFPASLGKYETIVIIKNVRHKVNCRHQC